MFAHGQMIRQWMEQIAPSSLAVPNDRIGLQFGTLHKEFFNVLVALDVNEKVIAEAIAKEADLIIAHHPIIYQSLKHLQTDTPAGGLYAKLLQHQISVYIAHTNYDIALAGMNDCLAQRLGLMSIQVLEPTQYEQLQKLIVFVPLTHVDQVRQALFAAGAGHIGKYSHCSFNIEGVGTFQPNLGAKPHIGVIEQLEAVQEVRIETVVPQSLCKFVIQQMIQAHPYEEVAYDLYTIDKQGRAFGLGRVGKLPAEITLRQLVGQVKSAFSLSCVRVVGYLEQPVRNVAVVGGSGSRYIQQAIIAGAEVLITGDIDYHTAHDALAAGLMLIDAGHHIEQIMKKDVAIRLQEKAVQQCSKTHFHASTVNTEPFQFV